MAAENTKAADEKPKKSKVIIIGSGPAGLTAAIYAARAELKPIVIAGEVFGGQLMNTTLVENFPGFPEGIEGPELMMNMVKQAEKYGSVMVYENATEVDFDGKWNTVTTTEGEYQANAVIVTTGSSPRRLDIPGEDKFWGKGVSTCATCDGAFYRDKVVAVVGGGDSAMEEASFLTKFAKKVYIVHRRDEFRASKIMQERVMKKDKIEIIWNTEVKEVIGDKTVDKLKIHNSEKDETTEIEVDGMFLAIGQDPNTGFLENHMDLDGKGYVVAQDAPFTRKDGVFVAGEIVDHKYKQAITSAGMGCRAAMDAEQWIEEKGYDE